MTTQNKNTKTNGKANLKKVTEEAQKMSAVELTIKKFEKMVSLTKDRSFFQHKIQMLEKQLIAINESDSNLFDSEDRGLRLEFTNGYNGSMVKISNEHVIIKFIEFITEQMNLKITEIDEQIIKVDL